MAKSCKGELLQWGLFLIFKKMVHNLFIYIRFYLNKTETEPNLSWPPTFKTPLPYILQFMVPCGKFFSPSCIASTVI